MIVASCSFRSTVFDIHSVLEVTVFDENPDKKMDFLGRIAVPLLKAIVLSPLPTAILRSSSFRRIRTICLLSRNTSVTQTYFII